MDDSPDPGAADDASSDDNDAHMDPTVDDPNVTNDDSSSDINEGQELTCYFYRAVLGFNRPASIALWTDQGLRTECDFLRLKPDQIDKLCIAIKKDHKTTISVAAAEHLGLLVYYLRHQARTSRYDHSLLAITQEDLDSLSHHMEVELNWDKSHKIPDPTLVALNETSNAKVFSAMKHLLACMRGYTDVPLSYGIRKNLLPPDWGPADPKHQTSFGHPTSLRHKI